MSPSASVDGCVLVTTSAARQTLGGPRIRGRDSWLDDTDKKFGPNLPLLFKLHEIWSVDSQEHHQNCCHQMSDSKAKMHQIRFRQTPLGELTALARPPSWI